MEVTLERALALLRDGSMEILGIMPRASNYTFAVKVGDGDLASLAVYKPQTGETPLWDFPEGTLYKRELAAFALSEALGWSLVPPTVEREGPHGIGSMQLFVNATPGEHYMTLAASHPDVFARVAAFDVVANNADRKSGHCLREDASGRIWMIDHGVCFHADDKLRTVIWDFAGQELPADIASDLSSFAEQIRGGPGPFADLLDREEIDAMRSRVRALLDAGRFPEVPEDRRAYPWPPI